jgi:hypothetical protein
MGCPILPQVNDFSARNNSNGKAGARVDGSCEGAGKCCGSELGVGECWGVLESGGGLGLGLDDPLSS